MSEKPLENRPASEIIQSNIDFIQKLTGREKIGADKAGRLYQISGFGFINIFLKNTKDLSYVVQQTLQEMAANRTFVVEESSEKFKQIVSYLSQINAISPSAQQVVLETFYRNRLERLKESLPELVAQATVSIEMSCDPLVSTQRKAQIMPKPTTGGTSGSYFIKDLDGNTIGVFKPMDEEVFMPNNPMGKAQPYHSTIDLRMGPRTGHQQGSSWTKEVGAYLVDRGEHANVPYTTPLTVPFPIRRGNTQIISKTGSIQEFKRGVPAEELKTEEIESIPIAQSQKIALLDLLIGNSDRNLGNMLWDRDGQELIPIDHGLCLLDSLDWQRIPRSETSCAWIVWPQMKQPVDPSLVKWIQNFDIEQKQKELAEAGISESSLREFTTRAIFLKAALEKGLNLYEIGILSMENAESGRQCPLDHICRLALNEFIEKYGENVENKEEEFYTIFNQQLNEYLNK